MSVLAIDIGNSRVGLGVFSAGKSLDPAVRLTHEELDAELDKALNSLWQEATAKSQEEGDEAGLAIASVVPAMTKRIEAAVAALGAAPLIIGRDASVPLKTKLRDDSGTGVDRLLAALAAYVNVERACVIVHCGSALVVDAVDDEGVFLGGAIAPGLRMGMRALHDYAAQLPQVSLTPPEDAEIFGRYTEAAINLGLFVGVRGATRELIERFASSLGSWPHVVATGGDAQAILEPTGLVDSLVPDLVLQGAALVWEHSRGKV